jgi:hypothetical protein
MIEKSDLDNRGPGTVARSHRKAQDDAAASSGDGTVDLESLVAAEIQRRLARVDALKPGRKIHCGHCWGQGRQATLDLLRATA